MSGGAYGGAYGHNDDDVNPFEVAPQGGAIAPPAGKPKKGKKGNNAAAAAADAQVQAQQAAYTAGAYAQEQAAMYGAAASSAINSSEIAAREAALRAKEMALLAKEKELEERERKMGFVNNWPSSCYALTYHDISKEIPPQLQSLIRKFYFFIRVLWLALFWNFITVLTIFLSSDGSAGNAVFSAVYLIGIPGAWILWYRPIYYACRDLKEKKTTLWFFFFINWFATWVWCVLMGLGVESTASGGFFVMITQFNDGMQVQGFFGLIVVGLYWLLALVCIFLARLAYKVFKESGAKDKMRTEAKIAGKAAGGMV